MLVDFEIEPFHLGIRFGAGRYPGLVCEKLADDAWVVVASPVLVERANIRSIHDLARRNLLADDHPNAWDEWFEAAGVPAVSRLARIQITDSSMLVDAVLRGQGVGLARWSLACDELSGGRLALVFPTVAPLRTKPSYYLVGPRESVRRAPVQAFGEWLRREAQTLRDFGTATPH